MSKEDILKLLKDTFQEFVDCDGGNTSFIFEDKTYHTDTGYALEGIEFFIERIKIKLEQELELYAMKNEKPQEVEDAIKYLDDYECYSPYQEAWETVCKHYNIEV